MHIIEEETDLESPEKKMNEQNKEEGNDCEQNEEESMKFDEIIKQNQQNLLVESDEEKALVKKDTNNSIKKSIF